MGFRRIAREITLQLLYELDLARKSPAEIAQELSRHEGLPFEALPEEENSPSLQDFVLELLNGVMQHREEIDLLLEKCALHWKLHRMACVDRNLLRLAIFELVHRPDIPASVSINEAIEIAKHFGTQDSAAFINGILDHIAKDLKKA